MKSSILHQRSLHKAISWRMLSSTVTWIATLCITHSMFYATSLSIFEVMGKIGLFYCHERSCESGIDLKSQWQAAKQVIGKYFSFEVAKRFPMM